MEANFYSHLASFTDFEEVAEDVHYTLVPEDWCLVRSQVIESERLIQGQRYKDINTIGAATIVAVKNALGKVEIPYVFVGDGATLLIPESYRDLATQNLSALQEIARQRFEMKLRITIVAIADLAAREGKIEVAKFELITNQTVALFRGGGIALAESMVKSHPEKFEVPQMDSERVNLSGLSCRWHEIPNKHGFILSLVVKAREDNAKQVYRDLIARISSIFGGVLSDANPVNPSLMTYHTIEQMSENEKRLEKKFSFAAIKRRIEIVAAAIIFRWKLIPQFVFHSEAYRHSMRTHADYRDFDDMFRMILDCSPQQVMELSEYLDIAHDRGELCYGIHQSQTSLMTCFVQGVGEGEHIHFMDGGDGGYAKATRNLNEQLGERRLP